MSYGFSISIDQVVDLLGLERDPRHGHGRFSYNVKCPFCDDKKYHMNINPGKNAYNCVRCQGDKTGGGALDLYGRAALGVELRPGKTKAGGNGDFIFAKLCEALSISKPDGIVAQRLTRVAPVTPRRASDERLDAAYRALLAFRPFALNEQHRSNLKCRGLDDVTIDRNGYRSATDFTWTSECTEAWNLYKKEHLAGKFNQYESLRRLPVIQRIAGIAVGKALAQKGVSMEGVPGFFYFPLESEKAKLWIFRIEPGMLIPTRNSAGQIVCLQARKDSGSLRYMTVSSKDLPGGVVEGISRAHFPLGNCKLAADTKVYITEGPLKADIAVHLLKDPALFVALHGVNNRGELPVIFDMLRNAGVTRVINCLDMDKLTNPHVAAAGKSMRNMAKKHELQMMMHFWDDTYARAKFFDLLSLSRFYGIPASGGYDNVFVAVGVLADILSKKGFAHSTKFENQAEIKDYWSGDTKGIDDYMNPN